MQFMSRFIVGGFLIAILPIVANRFGNRMAGLIAVFPVTIGVGLIVLLQARGIASIKGAAIGSLLTLPATAAFLTVIIATTGRLPVIVIFSLGLLLWSIVAIAIYTVIN